MSVMKTNFDISAGNILCEIDLIYFEFHFEWIDRH